MKLEEAHDIEAKELKAIFKKGLTRRVCADLKVNKSVKGGILDTLDASLDKSSIAGTAQHNEVLKWAADLIDNVVEKIGSFVDSQ